MMLSTKTPRELLLEREVAELRARLEYHEHNNRDAVLVSGMVCERDVLTLNSETIERIVMTPAAKITGHLDRGGSYRVLCRAGPHTAGFEMGYMVAGPRMSNYDTLNRMLPDLHLNFLHNLARQIKEKKWEPDDVTLRDIGV